MVKIEVGYSEFIDLCRINDPVEWVPWLEVKPDGVYIREPDADLTPKERAALTSGHPLKDLTKPALKFPCTLRQMVEFLEVQECYGCIDSFDMAIFIESGSVSKGGGEPNTKGRNSYLRTIETLCRALTKSDLTQPKAVEDVLTAISRARLEPPVDSRTLHNYLKEARELRDN